MALSLNLGFLLLLLLLLENWKITIEGKYSEEKRYEEYTKDKTEIAESKPLAGGRGGGKDSDDKEYKNGNKTGK